MRLLFLSNYYPPHALGGYEQWCQEVATALVERGHAVHVLTARPDGQAATVAEEDGVAVHRKLHLELNGGLGETIWRLLWTRPRLEASNLRAVRDVVTEVEPDAALVWGMWNVPRTVPATVEQLLPERVAYYLCDYWLTLPNAYIQRWREPARNGRVLTGWAKRLLGNYFLPKLEAEPDIPLQLAHPICVSQAVCDLLAADGVSVTHGRVIYGGTQVDDFLAAAAAADNQDDEDILRLLYVGRLVADKGVHDVLEAMRRLKDELSQQRTAVTLDIYGQGDPDYTAGLRAFVRAHNLEEYVTFQGNVPRSQIPDILARHDVLVFPSTWHEPFARTVLEAMAAGLVVVGAPTGGTGEILKEGKTGLTFPAGDAAALAAQIVRLVKEPGRRRRLARAGQTRVVEDFSFTRMVDELETTLTTIAESKPMEALR
jgi:glycosyltransferase involved in cell wall biosynthesis